MNGQGASSRPASGGFKSTLAMCQVIRGGDSSGSSPPACSALCSTRRSACRGSGHRTGGQRDDPLGVACGPLCSARRGRARHRPATPANKWPAMPWASGWRCRPSPSGCRRGTFPFRVFSCPTTTLKLCVCLFLLCRLKMSCRSRHTFCVLFIDPRLWLRKAREAANPGGTPAVRGAVLDIKWETF